MTRMIRAEHSGGALVASSGDWSWQDDAACAGDDLLLFFGRDGERAEERERREERAREICSWCPVVESCREYALEKPERFGFWAGMSEEERSSERRRRLRRARAKAA
jgi:WhiB family redox-sensing transcriptional regulator